MKAQATKSSADCWRLAALCAWLALPIALPAAGSYRETYTYDAADRLQSVVWDINGTNATLQVEYDAAGNRTRSVTVGVGNAALDSDGDGLPDAWELRYFGNLGQTGAGDYDADGLSHSNELAIGSSPLLSNTDGDPASDYEEWVANTNPSDAQSYFRILAVSPESPVQISIQASSNRVYTLTASAELMPGGWTMIPGQERIPGHGSLLTLTDTNVVVQRFYRVRVGLP